MYERALSPLLIGGIEVRKCIARAAMMASGGRITVRYAARGGLNVAAETIRH